MSSYSYRGSPALAAANAAIMRERERAREPVECGCGVVLSPGSVPRHVVSSRRHREWAREHDAVIARRVVELVEAL